MANRTVSRRAFMLGAAASVSLAVPALAQQPNLREPVYRVGRTPTPTTQQAQTEHPLDPALKWAYDGLAHVRNNVRDYTCTVVKRERIGGELGEQEFMVSKIRNRKEVDGRVVTPFSVYMYFVKPTTVKGREVLYVEGKNSGKMIAHEGGTAGRFLPSVWIAPDGVLAMRGQRYPITDLGIENLLVKLIEKGERDRRRGECEVKFYNNAKISGRGCTCIEVTHPHRRPYFDFHVARIYIDNELQVPIRYAAYQWPTEEGGKPVLDEEYTYLDMKVNVGLTDEDFESTNKEYNF